MTQFAWCFLMKDWGAVQLLLASTDCMFANTNIIIPAGWRPQNWTPVCLCQRSQLLTCVTEQRQHIRLFSMTVGFIQTCHICGWFYATCICGWVKYRISYMYWHALLDTVWVVFLFFYKKKYCIEYFFYRIKFLLVCWQCSIRKKNDRWDLFNI